MECKCEEEEGEVCECADYKGIDHGVMVSFAGGCLCGGGVATYVLGVNPLISIGFVGLSLLVFLVGRYKALSVLFRNEIIGGEEDEDGKN